MFSRDLTSAHANCAGTCSAAESRDGVSIGSSVTRGVDELTPRAGSVSAVASFEAPHAIQNFAVKLTSLPQVGHFPDSIHTSGWIDRASVAIGPAMGASARSTGVPHAPQNGLPGLRAAPHLPQACAAGPDCVADGNASDSAPMVSGHALTDAPHIRQNRFPTAISVPQARHSILISCSRLLIVAFCPTATLPFRQQPTPALPSRRIDRT